MTIFPISIIIKNLDVNPHEFGIGISSLVDIYLKNIEGRQYSKDSASYMPSIAIPRNDTINGSVVFKIPSISNPGKLYYKKPETNGSAVRNIQVNLTATKSPLTGYCEVTGL
jgi:hypothetical protein